LVYVYIIGKDIILFVKVVYLFSC